MKLDDLKARLPPSAPERTRNMAEVSDIVERVARAMFISDGVCSEHDWGNANNAAHTYWRNQARAAITAMLEAVGEPVEGGLQCASSWLENHAQHVGRCVGDSACTCGLVRIRLDVSLGLYSLAALREEV